MTVWVRVRVCKGVRVGVVCVCVRVCDVLVMGGVLVYLRRSLEEQVLRGLSVNPGQLQDGKQLCLYFPSCPFEWFEFLQ